MESRQFAYAQCHEKENRIVYIFEIDGFADRPDKGRADR